MENNKFSANRNYIKKSFDNLLNVYRNKYILVHEQQVVGSFDTYAANEGVNTYGIEEVFMVYLISETTPVNFVALADL